MRKKIEHAEKLLKILRGKDIFLFLDYDGTLAPIADRPEAAFLPEKTKSVLRNAALIKGIKIAVISGRPLDDLKKLTGVKGLIYAGNQGMEISGNGMDFTVPVVDESLKALKKALAGTREKLAGVKGILIEDKKYSYSVHYRLAGNRKKKTAERAIFSSGGASIDAGLLKLKKGKMVFELAACAEWDKGKAVLWMLEKANLKGGLFVPVFAGDDKMDFEAFRAIKGKGHSVFIGAPNRAPKPADFYLKNTFEAAAFISKIADIKEKEAAE